MFSISHPLADFLTYQTKQHFEVEHVSYTWRGFGGEPVVMPSYRRPLCAVLNPLIEAGFRLEHIVEPQPTAEFRLADPEHYAKRSSLVSRLSMLASLASLRTIVEPISPRTDYWFAWLNSHRYGIDVAGQADRLHPDDDRQSPRSYR